MPTAKLSGAERRFLIALGTPALGMAFTVTVVSTYVPVILESVSNPIEIGLLIGGEGFAGIFLPALVGNLSDRRSEKVSDRIPLMLVFAGVVVAALLAVGVLAALGVVSLLLTSLALVALYVGYYAFLAPYWALFPDLVPDEQSGRSVSAEGSWRVAGTGLALVAGGLLLDVQPGLPFLVAAGLVVAVVAAMLRGIRDRTHEPVHREEDDEGASVHAIRELWRDRDIRLVALANGLWNFALMALRAFVVLFFVEGLDRSSTFVSTVIFPLVAVGIAVGAPLSGWLADRVGHVRLLLLSVGVYGVVMAAPAITQAAWVIALIPVIALAAAVVMTLPLSLLMRVIPPSRHGAASGLFGVSRGIGSTLGPIAAGVAIVVLAPVLDSTRGYGAMWLVCSAALLASLPMLWALRRDSRL